MNGSASAAALGPGALTAYTSSWHSSPRRPEVWVQSVHRSDKVTQDKLQDLPRLLSSTSQDTGIVVLADD
ncbi:hypothetical protein J6590_005809 [Homalodisca vitripennis]|nr:hypothetical protein J6590_005809 [Homalodisca vitripennis]